MKKALIAMSGGVDSSVSAYLMKEQGYDCIGCTMKLYNSDGDDFAFNRTCCSLSDVEDARSVAYSLGMPYYVFNFTQDFKEKIINKFISCYESGITPNPCIDCNRYMKFDKLFDRAKIMNCEYIVTGHYARIEKNGEKFVLKKGVDDTKDQSYVLYAMTQEQLAHTKFPLGNMRKDEIRNIAEKEGFTNAHKPDSQDICFVPGGDYVEFLNMHSDKISPSGKFVDINGKILGEHKGIINYTIGQRRGLGIAFSKPMYVCNIDALNNTVTLGENKDLLKKELFADDFNWISGAAPKSQLSCKAKIRYSHKEENAIVKPLGKNEVKIIFDEPQRAITKGQAVVLYDGDIVLGGGIIK